MKPRTRFARLSAHRAQHPELFLSLLRQHHEDIDDEKDPGENRKLSDTNEERTEAVARRLGIVEPLAFDVIDADRWVCDRPTQRFGDAGRKACTIFHTADVRDRYGAVGGTDPCGSRPR